MSLAIIGVLTLCIAVGVTLALWQPWRSDASTPGVITTIATSNDLITFRNQVNAGNNFSDQTVMLTQDIDMSGVIWDIGIGSTAANAFQGIFDGNGFEIQNMSGVGLFANITNSELRNLSVIGVTFTTSGLVSGTATNSIIQDISVYAMINSPWGSGGLVTTLNSSEIRRSSFTGGVVSANGITGGMVSTSSSAIFSDVSVTITSPLVGGSATANNFSVTGGVVGFAPNTQVIRAMVRTELPSGSIVTNGSGAGLANRANAAGFVGSVNNNSWGVVSESILLVPANHIITSGSSIRTSAIIGFLGQSGTLTSTNNQRVAGTLPAGVGSTGNFGPVNTATIRDNAWFTIQSNLETYLDWDFDDIWTMDASQDFPVLRRPVGTRVLLGMSSTLFQFEAPQVVLEKGTGRYEVDFNDIVFPDVSSHGVEILGLATSIANANNGIVTYSQGDTIVWEVNNRRSLFAVYQFNPRRTLTVVQADGILAFGANFQRVFYRPGVYVTAGTTNQLPLAFGRLDASGVEVPNATHIGWATSLQNARNGIVEWQIATNFVTQPNLFENTRIYAVWQRNTDARVEFRRSHFHPEMSEGNFPSIDFVNDTRFDLEYIEFDTAQTHPPVNLAQFNPGHITHTGTPGFAFAGWATTPNGAPVHSPTATVTFNESTALYAVWEPIRLTVFFSSVYNTGITSLTFDLETVGATVNLTAMSPPGYDNAPGNIAIGNFQTNVETFEFLGFASTLTYAQNGNANVGFPVNFAVTGNITLHATWNALGMGVALPPIEGGNPQDLAPNPSLDALSQPLNITFNESTGILSWEWTQGAYGAAHGFRVYINGTPHTFVPGTLTRSANISDLLSDTGTYQIRVRTIGNNVTNTHSDVSIMYVEITPNTSQLLAPINVVVGNSGVVTWNNPNLASNGYRVYIFDNTGTQVGINHTSNTTSFDLETLTLLPGQYTVRIVAVGGGLYTDSPQSTPTSFWVDQQGNILNQDPGLTTPVQLGAPQNVRVIYDNGQYVLKWDTVANSHFYRIYINGNVWYTTTNLSQISVILHNFPHGDFAIRIRALAPKGDEFVDSEQSTTLTIRVQYDDDGYDEIVIICPNDPNITTPPPPGITPPNSTTPYPPTLETDDPTFIDWLRSNWWWLLICLVVLILTCAFAVAIARRRDRNTTIIHAGTNANASVGANCTLESDANAAIKEARKKLKDAINQVNVDEHSISASMSVGKADQALDHAVQAVAEYQKSKKRGKK